MRARNNLNNVVIYLLTRKVNRYYPQRLYRNSAGRIKVAESKALDWSCAFLRVIPGCKLMSFWLSHGFPTRLPPRTTSYLPQKPSCSALAKVGAQRKPTKLLFWGQDTNHLWLFLSELNWDPFCAFFCLKMLQKKI